MRKLLFGFVLGLAAASCAAAPTTVVPPQSAAASEVATPERAALQVAAPEEGPKPEPAPAENGPWIGASGESDLFLAGSGESFLGVWVDVPASVSRVHAPVALTLVIDTSGSMAGDKMQNARLAAKSLVDHLDDGDIVSIATFSDHAQERLAPTPLDALSRRRIDSTIQELSADGGTNMFEGLRLGESRLGAAPATHAVRRLVMISDGIANVGPSSPEVLGAIAAMGADQKGVQVTALGVGLDYDENLLNALVMRSSGRLYHLVEPRELPSILESELALLQSTRATDAFVEVVPAPGVQLLGVDGVRFDWIGGGGMRVALGSMFGGQHREMLVRVRINSDAPGQQSLASVRLHFRDPAEGNLPRVQEVVAHYELTRDASAVALRSNARAQSIVAVQQAAQASVRAAQQLTAGDFEAAERQLAQAESDLRASASKVKDASEKQRVITAANNVAKARKGASAAAAAPAAARPAKARAEALDMNRQGMADMGF